MDPISTLLSCDIIQIEEGQVQIPGIDIVLLEIPESQLHNYIEIFKVYKGIRHKSLIQVYGIAKTPENNYFLILEPYDNDHFKKISLEESTSSKKKMRWIRQISDLFLYCSSKNVRFPTITMELLSITESGFKVIPSFNADFSMKYLSAEEIKGNYSATSEMFRVGTLMYKLFFNQDYIADQSGLLERKILPIIDNEFEKSNPLIVEVIRELLCYNWEYRMTCEELKKNLNFYFNIS